MTENGITGSDAYQAGRYPAKLPTCKKEGLKDSSYKANESLFNKGNHQQTKVYADVVHRGGQVSSQKGVELGSMSPVALAWDS